MSPFNLMTLYVSVVHTHWSTTTSSFRRRTENGSFIPHKSCHLPRCPVTYAGLKRNALYYPTGSPAMFWKERENRENCEVVGVFRWRHHLGNEHSSLPDHESGHNRKLQKLTGNDMYQTLAVLQRWLWEKKHLRTAEFWITVTVDIAVHITKNVNYLVLFVTRHADSSYSPPQRHSQASCRPSMFVYLWNGTTLPWGKK